MRLKSQMLVAFVGLSVLLCPSIAATDQSPSDKPRHESVPLSPDDIRDITAQVVARQPLLSASPGIKFASANRISGTDFAVAIYHPHSEEAGIKQAYQVTCARQLPVRAWNCDDASIRRYLALDTQEYEVRVTGPIEFNAAMALIEASRQALPLVADDVSAVPDTVQTISSFNDSVNVVWVNFEGGSSVLMSGQLAEGGDPAQPDAWIVNRFDRELLGAE